MKIRNMKLIALSVGALLFGQTVCASQSVLDGVWKLESMISIDKDGNIKPWCEGAFGVIIYTDGYMSTAVNCTTDPSKIVLYSGPFRLENQTVYHDAQNFSQASLNKTHVRNFFMPDENHLELRGDLGDGKVLVKWARR